MRLCPPAFRWIRTPPRIVSDLVGQVQTPYGEAILNTSRYSAPIYTVPAGQSTVNVSWTNCLSQGWESPALVTALQNVPIPAAAVPSLGSDADLVNYQPSTDTEWELWKAAQSGSSWSACGAGEIQNVSQNPGIFSAGGITGSGLPMLGYLIRTSQLQSGAINHAVDVLLPCTRKSTFSWPAWRTDGSCTDANAPIEGERFRLPASLDLSTLNLSPGELMIATAMQQYGAIVTDYAGRVAIQAEDPRPYEVNGAPNPMRRTSPARRATGSRTCPTRTSMRSPGTTASRVREIGVAAGRVARAG
jgi:hypothetical protein